MGKLFFYLHIKKVESSQPVLRIQIKIIHIRHQDLAYSDPDPTGKWGRKRKYTYKFRIFLCILKKLPHLNTETGFRNTFLISEKGNIN